jgi:hypothetical protein
MFEPNVKQQLQQWNLYKAYGEFNIRFEGVIASYRNLLIVLIKKYYRFDVDWEEEDSEVVLPEHLKDRLIKILLHDNGAMAIIEKCRSCFLDITSEEVASVLAGNNIEPLKLNEFDIKFADMFFKKGIELVQLRNILIHTHYEGGFFDWDPITKLDGVKDKKLAKGFKMQKYSFDIPFIETMKQQLDVIYFYLNQLKIQLSVS